MASSNEPYEVVIIGAGPSGLVSAKTLLAHNVAHILVLDESDETGGLWTKQVRPSVPCRIVNHNGETAQEVESSSQPVYSDLRANFPKDLTSFLGYPFVSRVEHFPPAETVASYYQGYGRRYGVDAVTRMQTRVDRCVKESGPSPTWSIYTTNTKTGKQTKFTSKRLLVCNGHYRKAYCPHVQGIEHYKGRILHSSAFRSALDFEGQTVLIVGASISGCDIAKILATRGKCSHIVISTRKWKLYQDLLLRPLQCKGVVARPGVASMSTDGMVSFSPPSGPTKNKYSPIGEEKALRPDVIIFATGYRYYFPFLESLKKHDIDSSTCEMPATSGIRVMRDDGFKMERLYKRILSLDDQSLAFIGITNQNLSPAIMMEYQARWFTHMVVQEQCRTLDPAVMAQEVEARADDPTQDGLLLKFPSYCTSLASDIGIRGYWMQLLCDRLPLILQTWWTRHTAKPWLMVGAGLAAVAIPIIGSNCLGS
mgnify:CR=1 FL=1